MFLRVFSLLHAHKKIYKLTTQSVRKGRDRLNTNGGKKTINRPALRHNLLSCLRIRRKTAHLARKANTCLFQTLKMRLASSALSIPLTISQTAQKLLAKNVQTKLWSLSNHSI